MRTSNRRVSFGAPALLCLLSFGAGCSTEGPSEDDPQTDAETHSDARLPLADGAAPSDDAGPQPSTDLGPREDAQGPDEDASAPTDAQLDAAAPDEDAAAPDTDADLPQLACRWPAGSGQVRDGLDTPAGRVTVAAADDLCARQFTLSSTAERRDDLPANPRVIRERAAWPKLRTRNDLIDALYALSVEEADENAVEQINDYAFNNGQPTACAPGGCYETGRKWNYVWTRDTAYAVDLGLGQFDPVRARNSLEFKLSTRRGGGDLQIVQDTGTGGSYPISSDRVVWAHGARALLGWLEGEARADFAQLSLMALQNTLEHDRVVVFDPTDGLYRGEQSFLDWREQTYPAWMGHDLSHIGMSKTLGTNVGHLAALRLTADLAQRGGQAAAAARYGQWAQDLQQSIRDRLWLPSGQLAAFVPTTLDPAASPQHDTLGLSLAILADVLDPEEARLALTSLPIGPTGPAVIWPQQQHTPIYHNRAQWPFVTAYWVRAGAHANHAHVVDAGAQALVRGAALHLSNMENLELITGKAWLEDGDASGPVVNSQRQLWSVAGFLSLFHQTLFGLRPDPLATEPQLTFEPYLTRALREGWFAESDELVLSDLPFGAGTLDVVLQLPTPSEDPLEIAYVADRISVDGQPLAGALAAQAGHREIVITLKAAPTVPFLPALQVVDERQPWQALYAPQVPSISVTQLEGQLQVDLTATEGDLSSVRWEILRDGEVVARDLPGETLRWTDEVADGARSHCYTARLRFTATGTTSQHAQPSCWWGPFNTRIQTFYASNFEHEGGQIVEEHGRTHLALWGDPGHWLKTPAFEAEHSGTHLVQAEFSNGAGPVNTGITCAVQTARVLRVRDGAVVGEGYLLMPHQGGWDQWRNTNFVEAQLEAGESYQVQIGALDEWAINMSFFEHFSQYTGGTGGLSGAFNRANVSQVKVLARP